MSAPALLACYHRDASNRLVALFAETYQGDIYGEKSGYEGSPEFFIRLIGWLYDMEEQYRLRHLTPKQIQQERQGEKTTKIINQMRQRLDKLQADTSGMRGDLMHKALNYLNSFWNQLILYLKDGRYSIDRSSFARLLPTGRK